MMGRIGHWLESRAEEVSDEQKPNIKHRVGFEGRGGGRVGQLLFPPASCTSSIVARQAASSLSQHDLNAGPSPQPRGRS